MTKLWKHAIKMVWLIKGKPPTKSEVAFYVKEYKKGHYETD